MEIVIAIVVLFIGMLVGTSIGMIVGKKRANAKVMGRLRIDHSELDEPTRMFVELKNVTPDMIAQEKFVTFEVINENYISHD